MTAFYNEIDPDAVAALRELIARGIIAPGIVDDRSIKDVTANDLKGFTQVHLFAGAGLWSLAARWAGWPDSRPLWTASCPCQGESLAGKQLGEDDPRHLWPDVFRIATAARPPVIVGEQVAAAAGTHWLDRVCVDLESASYAARAVDIPACAVDSPQQRSRIYWIAVADTDGVERPARSSGAGLREGNAEQNRLIAPDADGPMGDAERARLEGLGGNVDAGRKPGRRANSDSGLGEEPAAARSIAAPDGRNGSWWADAEWIICHDKKSRRAKSSIPMLVNGMAGRSSLWRLAGNSISPVLAAEVLAAYLETEGA